MDPLQISQDLQETTNERKSGSFHLVQIQWEGDAVWNQQERNWGLNKQKENFCKQLKKPSLKTAKEHRSQQTKHEL